MPRPAHSLMAWSPLCACLLATVVMVALAAAAGCGSVGSASVNRPVGAEGRWVVAQPGETLGDIARRAGVPEQDLLEINGLRSPSDMRVGQSIFVLGTPLAETGGAPVSAEAPGQRVDARNGASRLRWPVEAPRVTSFFGTRWGRPHEGIDLTAPIGTPVLAAAGGEVVYAGNAVRGYGNMVVVKHEGELMTVYAHNSVLFVRVGDRVNGGQRVALSGQSGRASGPHVHFEVRTGEVPRDPLPYLPEIPALRVARERSPKS